MKDGNQGEGAAAIQAITASVMVARCIEVVSELGIADLVGKEPRTALELAAAIGADGSSLYRVLRMLASKGIFSEDDEGRFHLTPPAYVLQAGVEGSLRDQLRLPWRNVMWDTYREIGHTVMTGEPAFEYVHSMQLFEYLAAHPDLNAAFDAAMARISGPENTSIAASFHFGSFHRVVDVGGGKGGLLAAVLTRHSEISGVLFDQPQVVADPADLIAAGVIDRCDIESGDFFESVPGGGDIYVLKRILHDWDDESAITLLENCTRAMQPGGRVLVVDAVMLAGNQPDPNKALDIGMLLLTRGRERTEAEFEALFAAAGLTLIEIKQTAAPSTLSIVEGTPS